MKHTIKITRSLNTDIQTMGLFARYTLIFDGCYECSWSCSTNGIGISQDEKDRAIRMLYKQLLDNLDGLSRPKYDIGYILPKEKQVFTEYKTDEELKEMRQKYIKDKKLNAIEKRKNQINKMFQED